MINSEEKPGARAGLRTNEIRPIVLMAVRTEIDPLLKCLRVVRSETRGAFTLWRARLYDQDVWAVGCGMGKVNAALATQALIDKLHPRAVVMCGSAGGLCSEVSPGDLVVSSGVVQHDVGLNLGRRFTPMGILTCQNGRNRSQKILHADPELVNLTREVAGRLPPASGRQPAVHTGIIATGDQVIFSEERKAWIHATWGALAVEMEGAAVAQVASLAGIPWLIVRGISDAADETTGLDLSRLSNFAEGEESPLGWVKRQGSRLGYLATHPGAAGKLAGLWKGMSLALNRATVLTIALAARLIEKDLVDKDMGVGCM